MAKLTGMPASQKAPSLKNTAYVSTWRGITYLSSWPKKRSRPLPAHTQKQSEWFRQASILAKYVNAEQWNAALEATAGTPLYPRDVLTMAMAGTLFSLQYTDGRKLYSMATRNAVSQSLDVLGSTLGGVLVRQGEFWVPAVPNAPGEVLVAQGTGQPPAWQPGGGGSGGLWTLIDTANIDGAGIVELTGLDLTSYRTVAINLSELTTDTDTDHIELRLYVGGSLVTTAYKYGNNCFSDSASMFNYRSTVAGAMRLDSTSTLYSLGNAAGEYMAAQLVIDDPSGANNKALSYECQFVNPSGHLCKTVGVGGLKNSGAIDGVRVYSSVGTLQTGVVTVSGVAA